MNKNKRVKDELWEKYETHLINESVTKLRIRKLSTMYSIIRKGLRIRKANREKIEAFVTKLNKNEFLKADGKPYSGSSKSDIKKFLKQFYKWYLGNNEDYPDCVRWIKTKIAKDDKPEEKPVISTDEVLQLANSFSNPNARMLTLLLFDSGFRIQEALSILKRNITWEIYNEETGDKCFWIECNKSKTNTRKVPVPLFTDELKIFKNSYDYTSLKEDDLVFNMQYDTFRSHLAKNGNKVLDKKITPHSLRHSSATYYSREFDGNMNLIAERYGWTYNSKELALYIRKSGAYQRLGAKKVYNNQAGKLKEDNEKLKEEVNSLKSEMHAFKEEMLKMWKERKI